VCVRGCRGGRDDGHLYCLQAASGKQLWKFRGGPGTRKLIGNEQMISRWPGRSGVLIDGDRLYFTAGMWSRDGVFIYCLDPDDGSVIWKNDTSGYHFATLPHSTGGSSSVRRPENCTASAPVERIPIGRSRTTSSSQPLARRPSSGRLTFSRQATSALDTR
jgi:outer membrane protein assembly factor BamB